MPGLQWFCRAFFTQNGHTYLKACLMVPPINPESNMAKLKALCNQQQHQHQEEFRSDEDEELRLCK
ncbi:hypothetical protein H0H87_001874 [Tephrocybe sp. NHM501043]|nr:hypothetical protein H0H87_001874 [Tephrocybe sp. NHM501043]